MSCSEKFNNRGQLKKKIDMTISHLFHKNYLEHNGVIPQAKDTLNLDKTLKCLPVWNNKSNGPSLELWKATEHDYLQEEYSKTLPVSSLRRPLFHYYSYFKVTICLKPVS